MRSIAASNDALVEAMRGGDEQALGEIIDRYTAYVWAIVWNIVDGRLDREDAKSIVSDVFFTLWKNADRARPGRLKGYLASIARSRAVDALRRARQDLSLEDDMTELSVEGPETETVRREEYAALRRTLEGMPEPDRSIFIRHYYLYQKTAEIARIMGMKPGTVQTKLKRGRERLRRELTEGGYFIE